VRLGKRSRAVEPYAAADPRAEHERLLSLEQSMHETANSADPHRAGVFEIGLRPQRAPKLRRFRAKQQRKQERAAEAAAKLQSQQQLLAQHFGQGALPASLLASLLPAPSKRTRTSATLPA